MKKIILFLLLIPYIGFGQSVGTYYWARNYIKSPYYISGSDTLAQINKRGLNASFMGKLALNTTSYFGVLNVKGQADFTLSGNETFRVYPLNEDAAFEIYVNPRAVWFDETNIGYKVGIGSIGLTERLNVSGNIYTDGNIKVDTSITVGFNGYFGGMVKSKGMYGSMWTDDQEQFVGTTPITAQLFSLNGEAYNAIPDHVNDRIQVKTPGRYLVTISGSLACWDYDGRVKLYLQINGSPTQEIYIDQWLTAGHPESVSASSIVQIAANDFVQVAIKIVETTPQTIVANYMNLSLVYIGD